MFQNKKGFTLIELLVVISIIAVLLSVLMPALNMAKQKARMVICSNNLHQIAVGMNTYAASHDRYMSRQAGYPRIAYWGNGPDARESIIEYIASQSENLLFCPAALHPGENIGQKPGISKYAESIVNSVDRNHWSRYFWIGDSDYGGVPVTYIMGYNIFGGMIDAPSYGAEWTWIHTDNSDKSREPRIGGSSRDCIAADVQEAWWDYNGDWGLPGRPYRSNHSPGWQASSGGMMGPGDGMLDFVSSNAAYGDGHVESHKTLDYYVQRSSMDHGEFEY